MIGKLAIRVTSHVVAIVRSNGGAAAVELTLILPMLLMMLVGAVDFGLVIHQKMQLAHAVRAGAQHALVHRPQNPADLTKIENAILDEKARYANQTRTVTAALFCQCSDGSAIACSDSGKGKATCKGGGPKSHYISVTVQEDFETLLDYPVIGQSFRIKNDATFRVE